jgi:uncharacterized protein YkwD
MKTILLFVVVTFLFAGCKDEKSTTDSPSGQATKKSKKKSVTKKSTGAPSSSGSATTNTSFSSLEEEILFHVNKYRRSKGLSVLKMNSVITTEAVKHSKNMASGRTPFSHSGFSTRVNRISNQLGMVSASAENVAYGYLSAKEVVNGWLRSPGHKKNIEGRYTLTGIGVAKERRGKLFFTQLFVTK